MKLLLNNNTGLMEVSKIQVDGGRVIIHGTILGTIPVRAVLLSNEMRSGLSLLNFRTILAILRIMIFR